MELAKTAHAGFTYVPASGGRKRMYWKMSIDLTYPLVPSMGQHDPLDGYITYHELQATATWPKYVKEEVGSPMTRWVLAVFCLTPTEWRG
jgi:hypothetical protein